MAATVTFIAPNVEVVLGAGADEVGWLMWQQRFGCERRWWKGKVFFRASFCIFFVFIFTRNVSIPLFLLLVFARKVLILLLLFFLPFTRNTLILLLFFFLPFTRNMLISVGDFLLLLLLLGVIIILAFTRDIRGIC